MSFLYPQFLWALGALAIPIAIHLFNFRKTKKVYFTNVAFLKEVKTQTNSLRRLKELLVLLARLAFIAFLVFAFAQPFLPSKNKQTVFNTQSLVSIYLDNSFSMQSELTNRKSLDWGTEAIADLAKIFPKTTQFQLITNDFKNKEQYAVAANKLEDKLTEVNFSSEFRDLQTIYNRQINLLQAENNTKNHIFWFSDFQKSTLGELNKLQLDTTNHFYLVPIQAAKTANIYIDSVWMDNPFVKELEANTLHVKLSNAGEESYKNLVVKLFIEGIQTSTTSINLGANEKIATQLSFTVQGKGVKKCKVAIEDFPIVFDNEYYFTLPVAPTIRILHLHENKNNAYIESVYASEETFNISHYNIKNVDYNLANAADLVILNEVESIEGELVNILRNFVAKGGSLVVFPTQKLNFNSYNSFLTPFGVRNLQKIATDSAKVDATNTLAAPNTQNPFFQGMFEKNTANMSMPYAQASLQWMQTGIGLLNYKNMRPFLTQWPAQAGKVYVFASALDKKYTNFAQHALFVPIMYKIAALSKHNVEKLAYSFQDKIIKLKIKEKPTEQVYKLVQDKNELIPSQRMVGEELILELPEEGLQAGYYELKQGNVVENVLAFNYAKEESQMKYYTSNELKNILGKYKNVQIYENVNKAKLTEDFKEKNIGKPLWKYALVMALLFLLAEIALIRFWK